MGTKAYSYVRMSSERQLYGDSLRRQQELSREYAEEHNLELDESIRDLGVSAYSGDNVREGALGKFLELVESKKISPKSYLLIENFDRLSRENVMDAFSLLSRILSTGITVVTLTDKQVYTKESLSKDFGQILISLATMFRAHEESKTKSERIRKAFKKIRDDAMKGNGRYNINLPSWVDYAKGKYRLNEKADTVRLIFELVAEGATQMAVCRELTRRGIPTFKGAKKGWHQSAISHLLSSRVVIGEYVPMQFDSITKTYKQIGDVLPDYFPAAISKELFVQVNEARRKRPVADGTKGKKFSNLFNGLLVCKCCNGPMTMFNGGGKGDASYKYLRCYNRLRKDKPKGFVCENKGAIRYEDLEQTIFNNLGSFRTEQDIGSHDLMAAEAELLETENKLDRAEKQIVLFNDTLSMSDDAETIEMLVKQLDGANLRKRRALHRKEMLEISIQEMRLIDKGVQTVEILTDWQMLSAVESDAEAYRIRASLNARLKSMLRGIECSPKSVEVHYLGGSKSFDVEKGRMA
ncbi:recombinase family protein [Agrobacterium pusense]|uniref:recombinase family protein n=1 Tax=Agrobacterium pusense TaxID=648995 RepID=UPI0022B8F082|nr:recombinase family protein [Agrobacterium pusense]MCZ7926199.1 recombinase family protein [Agrobacterium pusense]